MKKRILCLALALLTALSYPLPVWSEEAPVEAAAAVEVPAEAEAAAEEPGIADEFPVYLDGVRVAGAHSILENGTTYVSVTGLLRAFCPECQISWAGGDSDVVYTGAGFTLSAKYGRRYLVCNERYLYLPAGARVHPQDSDLLAPVRVLAKAMGAELTWDENGVQLTSGAPLAPGGSFYDAGDVDLLARVVQHESGNQPLAGKIAVAQCILNRVKAGAKGGFANSVSGVIYQKGQFPGATNATPKSEAILAAKLALDGADVVGSAKWFNGVGKPCWASKNKRLIANIGNHSFYG